MAQVFGTGRYSETPIRTDGDCSRAAPIRRKRSCHESMIVSINKPCIYPFSLSRNASNSGMDMMTCLAGVLLSSLTTPASAS